MNWLLSHRADASVVPIADRHYNRQKIGAPQFVPPGRCLVLTTEMRDAFWVTSFPFAEWVRHEWAGAFVCSAFRNEGKILSSELIREAVAATVWQWPDIPEQGFVTFVDRTKTRSKKHFGYCYRMAGWDEIGTTKGGLVALGLPKKAFPDPIAPLNSQMEMESIV